MSTPRTPHNRPNHDSAAKDLDSALDALVDGRSVAHGPVSSPLDRSVAGKSANRSLTTTVDPATGADASRDADLIATAVLLQTRHRAVEPDPAFAVSLRHALLSPPVIPVAFPPRPAPSPVRLGSRLGVAHLPTSGQRRTGLFWPAAEIAGMVLIFAVFLGTISGGGTVLPRLVDIAGLSQDPPNSPNHPPSSTLNAPNFSPGLPAATPDPAVFRRPCIVPPADVDSLVATANAVDGSSSDRVATGTAISSDTGQPADQNVSDAILKTIATWIVCSNSGATDRAASVLTPRMFAGWDSITSDSPSTSPPTRITLFVRTVGPVLILSDDRALVQVDIDAQSVGEIRTMTYTFSMLHDGERWLIDEIAQSAPAQTTGTPVAGSAETVTMPVHVNLRSGATFSAITYVEAAPGSILRLTGEAVYIDGIVWQSVAGPGEDYPYYLPAAYFTAFGATIPNLPATDPDGLGVPDPSECRVTPIPLTDVAAYMGPAGPTSARSANTYLATVGDDTDADTRAAVVDTLRELFACHNAGNYTQSVALNTAGFYGRAGAGAYRPTGGEPDLATANPLSADDRSEILAIGDAHWLDDGRVGVILLGQSHDDPTQVTATFYILTLTGGRWLIDDAVSIETSARPGGSLRIESFTPPETEAFVDTQESTLSPPVAQPIFPVGATVTVRAATIVLRALPRTVSEPIARLSPPREMTVFGPLTDSGDALWLPVTDNESGVSGYVSLEIVLPPGVRSLGGFQIGQTVVTTSPVYLRDIPEPSALASDTLPLGIPLGIEATKISAGHSWIMVRDSIDGDVKWIAHDVLVAATIAQPTTGTPATPTTATPSSVSADTIELAPGQVVARTTDAVNLRSSPAFDDDNIIEQLAAGADVRVTGPAVSGDDATWWPVEHEPSGSEGFVVADFLQFDDVAIEVTDERATIVADYFEPTETSADSAVATPNPAAVACTVSPRPSSDLELPVQATSLTPSSSPSASPQPTHPATTADAITRAALTATLDELASCVGGGDPLRVYGLYSDWLLDWLLTLPIDGMSQPGQPGVFIPGLLVRVQPDAPGFGITLGDADILPDGRVRARVFVHAPGQSPEGFPTEYIFVQTDGRWLIDRVLDLGPLDQFQRQIAPDDLPVAGSTVSVLTENVYLRAAPSFSSEPIATLPAGAELVATGQIRLVDGVTWWQVTDPATGQTGHIVAVYLQYEELYVGVDVLDPTLSPVCAPAPFPTPDRDAIVSSSSVGGNGSGDGRFVGVCGA